MKSYSYEGPVNVTALRMKDGARLKVKLVPGPVLKLPDHKLVDTLVNRGALTALSDADAKKLHDERGTLEPKVVVKGKAEPGKADADSKADGNKAAGKSGDRKSNDSRKGE